MCLYASVLLALCVSFLACFFFSGGLTWQIQNDQQMSRTDPVGPQTDPVGPSESKPKLATSKQTTNDSDGPNGSG